MRLVTSADLALTLVGVIDNLSRRIRANVSFGEFHHIGATAIPGAITKGDLDVLLRVTSAQFTSAVAALRTEFSVKQPENWNDSFASFGDDSSYVVPVGVQLVVIDSESDFFLFLHDYFISDPKHLQAYNHIKVESAPLGEEEYWRAKDRFLAAILAAKPKRA